MELANIEKLITKYLNATTTLQEENVLRKYFSSENIAPHLQQYCVLFEYFKQSKTEIFTHNIKLKSNRKKNFKWLSVAVSVVLLVSIFIGKREYDRYQRDKQFAIIKNTLQTVSFNLNKGNDALYTVSDNLTKGNAAIRQLNTLPKTLNTVNKILNQ